MVHRLKLDFPQLTFATNGGITTSGQVIQELEQVDGVMIGREAYHNPWWLAQWDSEFFGAPAPETPLTREWVEELMTEYMAREMHDHGTPWSSIARHMLGLRNGLPGARRWRQVWSDHKLKEMHPRDVMALALDAVARVA
jgi:tRNA-dihydrouridine synthase A